MYLTLFRFRLADMPIYRCSYRISLSKASPILTRSHSKRFQVIFFVCSVIAGVCEQVCVFVSVEWLTHATELTVEQVWASPSEPVGPDVWLCFVPTVDCNRLYSDSFPAQGCKLRHTNFWWTCFDGRLGFCGRTSSLYLKGVDRFETRTQADTHPHQRWLRTVPWC